MNTLSEELQRYAASDVYPFHMPGHKRRGSLTNATDITEIDGFDNLHDPQGIILEEMLFAAKFYGTKETCFLVNGSTCGILAAVSAAVRKGGRLLVNRGCHISVYHAAALRDLELEYIEDTGILKTPDAILITSPTYEGCIRNVAHWAEYAKYWGIPLIVDEAHGAHFSMHPYFPRSAIHLGADLVIQSTHKTLPAMTQTALLHNVTGRVDTRKLRHYIDIYETSSPSYVLMASAMDAVHKCAAGSRDYFEPYVERLKDLREALSGMKHLHLVGGTEALLETDQDFPPFGDATPLDPGKIVIRRSETLSGPAIYRLLRTQYRLQPEMRSPDYCLLMTSVADTAEGFERLKHALLSIDRDAETAYKGMDQRHTLKNSAPPFPGRDMRIRIPPHAVRISDAMETETEIIPLRESIGCISADFIVLFPPDSPIIIPGEYFTKDVCKMILDALANGLSVTGLIDNGPVDLYVRCVRRGTVQVVRSDPQFLHI